MARCGVDRWGGWGRGEEQFLSLSILRKRPLCYTLRCVEKEVSVLELFF